MTSNTAAVKWTNQEKELLFTALEKHGPENLTALHKAVTSKSISSIEKLLAHYMILADHFTSDEILNSDAASLKQKSSLALSGVWLTKWASELKECNSAGSSSVALSESLRVIALLEDHPKANENSGIDLKRLYLYLSCIASGEALPELNEESKEFLVQCLLDLTVKAKMQRLPEIIDFVHDITRIFPQHRRIHINEKLDDSISQAFHHILSSNSLNPLELPPNFLNRKPDSDE